MTKLKIFILLIGLLSSLVCLGNNTTDHLLWMQRPAVSPDGKWIAFEYKGNLYKVSAEGGNAIPLTANSYYNSYPKWSRDGSQIAFASNRYGNFDVFIMPASGGEAKRLTYASTHEYPCDFSADGKQVYYETNAHDVYTSVRFPNDNIWLKLYAVPAQGGRSVMVNSAGTEFVNFNKAGDKFLFQDRKGIENAYRKHHISPITRDIWCFDLKTKTYTKLSDFKGEDREPVWGDGDNFYYLSERNGNQNIFSSSLNDPSKVTQLTTFEKNPVRNLSRSENGMLVFTQDGKLYTLTDGGTPKKLSVMLQVDFDDEQVKNLSVKSAGSEMAVSPNGKEIAFISRGDVFVTSVTASVTKQITNTPQQERMVNFSPDGRTLLYSVENAGSWDIYKATIADADPYFYSSTIINTQPVIATPKDEYQGIFSPDGTKIAYMEERNILKVYTPATKKAVTILPEGNNFSYTDGDLTFSWSPDGKYIVIESENGLIGRIDVDIVKADGTEKPINITRSAFLNLNPKWGASGKMIYYLSDKAGMANLAGGGQLDVFGLFFDRAAFEKYTKSSTEIALQQERKKLDSLSHPAAQRNPGAGNNFPDLHNLDDRSLRLTVNSAQVADAILSPDEEKLYTISTFGGSSGLWVTNQRTHEEKLLTKLSSGGGKLAISADGKWLYLLADGQLSRINTTDGSTEPIGIDVTQASNKAAERAYIMEHAYHLLAKKFYDPNLQGVDWNYYYQNYRRFLDYVNNNYDFEVLLSEFIGELNGSHSGAVYHPDNSDGDKTAALGLLYDLNTATDGLKVTAILDGGPFDITETNLKVGDVIDHIDGQTITADKDWSVLLNLKAGKNTQISFRDPVTKKQFKEFINPVSAAEETNTLLYKRWVRQMEHLTDSLSRGTIAYVHIPEMDDAALRATYENAIGKGTGKKAVVIDTRYNPGGNIHEQLMALLTANNTLLDRPQGNRMIDEGSTSGLTKPTCVIISEGNYSDGFNFPFLYQLKKAGKLVGMPAAGTGTGVWWETQVDPTLYFGIPQVGLSIPGANQPLLENHQINPDILVNDDYQQVLNGHDQQLEAAVKELLREINNQ